MMDDAVSLWLQGLVQGDEEAVQRIWEKYYGQLIRIASGKLGQHSRRACDEEDIAISAFHSFCRGVACGRFPRLNDRHDLWKLMLTITARKVSDQIRRDRRQKRGKGIVRGESAFMVSDTSKNAEGINRAQGFEPTPDFAVQVAEECERLLGSLPDETHRKIALCKLEGFSNSEIALQLDCTPRTVERKLSRIREVWACFPARDNE
jgi:RNA polymerase sigma factor (sigma-70 family)